MDPKSSPHSGSSKVILVLSFSTLEQGETFQKWTPFGELLEDLFSTKCEKNRKQEEIKIACSVPRKVKSSKYSKTIPQ